MDDSQPSTGPRTLNLQVNFSNLRAKLGSALDNQIRMVSIGYYSTIDSTPEEARMPGSGWHVSYSMAPPWTPEERRDNFQSWVFASAFRDLFEAFGDFLNECYSISEFNSLARNQGPNGLSKIEIDEFNARRAKYGQSGIDKKIRGLRTQHHVGLSSQLEESVLSFNRARNILTHHAGIVPKSYVDDTGMFCVHWKRLIMHAIGSDKREVQIGETLKKGEGLGMQVVDENREFHEAERVEFKPSEFAGICWTIFQAGDILREILEKAWFEPIVGDARQDETHDSSHC